MGRPFGESREGDYGAGRNQARDRAETEQASSMLLLDRVEVSLRGGAANPFVTNINYNAKGQR